VWNKESDDKENNSEEEVGACSAGVNARLFHIPLTFVFAYDKNLRLMHFKNYRERRNRNQRSPQPDWVVLACR